jgi:hypothetical protein
MPLEVTSVDALDGDGVTPIDPETRSDANRNTGYFARDTFMAETSAERVFGLRFS